MIVEFAHQVEELSIKSVSDLQKNILDYLRDVGICVNKIQLMSSEGRTWRNLKGNLGSPH